MVGKEYLATRIKPMTDYTVTAEVYWRDSENNLQLRHTTKTYTGKDTDTIIEYINYDAGHYGYVDVKLLTEGDTLET